MQAIDQQWHLRTIQLTSALTGFFWLTASCLGREGRLLDATTAGSDVEFWPPDTARVLTITASFSGRGCSASTPFVVSAGICRVCWGASSLGMSVWSTRGLVLSFVNLLLGGAFLLLATCPWLAVWPLTPLPLPASSNCALRNTEVKPAVQCYDVQVRQ